MKYYCEQGDPTCAFPKCTCDTTPPLPTDAKGKTLTQDFEELIYYWSPSTITLERQKLLAKTLAVHAKSKLR